MQAPTALMRPSPPTESATSRARCTATSTTWASPRPDGALRSDDDRAARGDRGDGGLRAADVDAEEELLAHGAGHPEQPAERPGDDG